MNCVYCPQTAKRTTFEKTSGSSEPVEAPVCNTHYAAWMLNKPDVGEEPVQIQEDVWLVGVVYTDGFPSEDTGILQPLLHSDNESLMSVVPALAQHKACQAINAELDTDREFEPGFIVGYMIVNSNVDNNPVVESGALPDCKPRRNQ